MNVGYSNVTGARFERQVGTFYMGLNSSLGQLSLRDESKTEKVYTPLQLHYHAPSEHTVDGNHYDLELHIVHAKNNNTELSVLGIFFDTKTGGATENEFLQKMITAQNGTNTSTVNTWTPSAVDLQGLVSKLDLSKLVHYEGSLTTPGCAEIVEWNVLVDPQPISAAQLQFFTRHWAGNNTFARGRGNNRRVQPIGSRYIYLPSTI